MKCCTLLLVLAISTAQVFCRDPIPTTRSPPLIHGGIHNAREQKTHSGAPYLTQIRAGSDSPTYTRQVTTNKAVAIGMLLALNSGVVNGVCLSGILHPTKQASAAVTGAWTNSALGAAVGNTDQFTFNAKCILSYCFGSFLSGVVNPNPQPFVISVPAVRAAFLIGSALLFASSTMLEKSVERDFIFLAAMANGIQNSLTSTTTANLVRSAHFSGITSDIGTFLGQVLRGNRQNLMKLKVFCALGLSFWTGGYCSYSLAKKFEARTLLFSSMLYLLLGLSVGVL